MSTLDVTATGAAADGGRRPRADARRRRGREPPLRPGPHPLGCRGRGRGVQAALLDGPRPHLATAGRRDRGTALRARRRPGTTGSCSAGWAAPRSRRRSSAPPPACPSSSSTPPTPTSSAARSPTSTAPSSSCRASPAPPSRPTASAAPSSRPSATPASTRTARIVVVTDPGSPLDGAGPRGRLPGRQRRPGRRRPLLGAHRLRPRARAAWPAPTSRLSSTTPRRSPTSSRPTTRPTRRCASARRWRAPSPLRDKLVLVDAGTENVGFGAWAEQLIAESTGKEGTGILPVVAIGDAPGRLYADGTVVRLVATDADADDDTAGAESAVSVAGARSGRRCCSGRPPRPSPGGSSASTRSTSPTSRAPSPPPATCSATASARRRRAGLHRRRGRGPRPRRATGSATPRTRRPTRSTRCSPSSTADRGYVAVMAYLDREADADLEHVARALVRPHRPPGDLRLGPAVPALHRPVPQGRSGDRRLRPGHRRSPAEDLAVPGRDFTFGQFIAAQAGR